MILSYKNFLRVILFIVLFGSNSFAQFTFPAFDWKSPMPSGDDYSTSINVPGGILFGGDGGSLIYADRKVKKILGEYLNQEVIGAAVDTNSYEWTAYIITRDGYGKYHLYMATPLGDQEIKSLGDLADEPLNSVSYVATAGNRIIMGGFDKIWTYVDNSFHAQPMSYITNYYVKVLPSGKGIAVGDSNSIYTSTDFLNFNASSYSWQNPINFSKVSIMDNHYLPGKILQTHPIFALGYQPATNSDVVCRSTDDGDSWDSVFAVPTAYMSAISVGSDANAIIGGYGVLYYTKDGGNTWEKGNSDNGEFIRSVTFISSDSAYAFGNFGIILLTADGGANWTQISGDISTNFAGVSFPSAANGFAAGNTFKGVLNIYETTDAGDNWTVNPVDSSFSFVNSLFFLNGQTGFVAGSKLLETTDGGGTWNESNTGTSSIIQDVYFVNSSLGFIVAGNEARKTIDGGITWNPLNMNTDFDKKKVYFIDENLGFISGGSTLYKTTDGGNNWDTLAVGSNSDNLNSNVTFINSTTGFFGKKGQVFKTTNMGDTWTDASIDNHSIPMQIQFASDSIGYMICTSDTFGIPVHVLFKTTDGGSSWFDLTDELPGSTSFLSMFFTDDSTGYLVGPRGKIIKTTTGGEQVVVTSVQQEDNSFIPLGYELYQNYPNPFNPSTTIQFAIPKESFTKVEIFNVLGEKVTTLVSEMLSPGSYKYKWDAGRYSSGVYFYRVTAGNFIQTKKLVLLK